MEAKKFNTAYNLSSLQIIYMFNKKYTMYSTKILQQLLIFSLVYNFLISNACLNSYNMIYIKQL